MSGDKLWKYRLLRHLPGDVGARYERKYMARSAPSAFRAAALECKGMTSIDLGANVGEYTRILAEHAGRVIAFEPDPWSLEQLRKNVTNLDNVEIVEAAAGVSDGEVSLYRHETFAEDPLLNSQSSSVIATKSNVSKEEMHVVPQIDFPSYLQALEEPVGVLKIDIEGAEVEILKSLFADPDLGKKVRYIFCETHERKIPEQAADVENLRARARRMSAPRVNLYWH